MTRTVLVVVPAVAVLAALVSGGGVWDLVAAGGIGAGAGAAVWAVAAARTRRFARRVTGWISQGTAFDLEPVGGRAWRELGTAVHTLATQLRAAQDELASAVPWSARLVASLEEPAFVFGPDQRLQAANPAGERFAGQSELDATPTPVQVLGSGPMADAVAEAAAGGRSVTLTVERAGRELRVTASPLDDHVLVVVGDRTRDRQVETLRRDFVINASHELKTPATAITMLVEAARVAPEERRPALLDRLDEESQRLSRLVHDLLDLRQLEETSLPQVAPVDLAELARAAVASATQAAERGGVSVRCRLPDSAVVAGERRELALVVDNLVTNAVQHNRPGGQVHVELERDGSEQVLTVRDTGIGIPRAALDRVFERFYRVDVDRSRARGGTGLGLSIVRHAVERHGGRVEVDSLLGSGTTMTVRLPITADA